MKSFVVIGLVSLSLTACRTSQEGDSESSAAASVLPEYDGSAETMDALPDCNQDMIGSLFWVRGVKTSYECVSDGQWTARGHADPDLIETSASSSP